MMKRYKPCPASYPDPSKPPEGEEDDSFSSDGSSKKVKTAQSFEALFDNEQLSDVVLNINNGQFMFNAHGMILGLKSEVLAVMINELPTSISGKQVLYLQESYECSSIFSRFLYFIYSGAVWLHRDYVLQLHNLANKYGVKSLLHHCEGYIFQIINNAFITGDYSRTFSLDIVCDLYENCKESMDIQNVTFKVLCSRFQELIQSERWAVCAWTLVRELLRSNECQADENIVLSSATDWMKKNNLNDKSRIEDILTNIRYPLLNRRVLYHLQKNSAFKNFPRVQSLVDGAIRYHCFKELQEASNEFVGIQYESRLPCVVPLLTSIFNSNNDAVNNNNIINNGHYTEVQANACNGNVIPETHSLQSSYSSLSSPMDHR